MAAAKVGFIGLGKMGRPMTEQLLKAGFEVYINNRSQGVVQELVQQGAKAAQSPREVAEACDFVLTCLPTVETVEHVYLGEGGVAEGGPGPGGGGEQRADHRTDLVGAGLQAGGGALQLARDHQQLGHPSHPFTSRRKLASTIACQGK